MPRGVRAGFWEKVTFEWGPEGLKGARRSVSWTFWRGTSPACLRGGRRVSVARPRNREEGARRGRGSELMRDLVGHGLFVRAKGSGWRVFSGVFKSDGCGTETGEGEEGEQGGQGDGDGWVELRGGGYLRADACALPGSPA